MKNSENNIFQELIMNIEKRPKMYVHEVRLDYIYYLLLGISFGLKKGEDLTGKDEYFDEYFNRWTRDWAKREYQKRYTEHFMLWYQIIEDNTNSNEEAVAKFYELSKQFFSEYKVEEDKVDR